MARDDAARNNGGSGDAAEDGKRSSFSRPTSEGNGQGLPVSGVAGARASAPCGVFRFLRPAPPREDVG